MYSYVNMLDQMTHDRYFASCTGYIVEIFVRCVLLYTLLKCTEAQQKI